jgi:hypothetical protein
LRTGCWGEYLGWRELKWQQVRTLHSKDFYNLYSPPSIIRMIKWRRMSWAGHLAQMAVMTACRRLVVKIRWETTWKTRCRWVDYIKMDLGETGWVSMDWIDVAWDRDQWRSLWKQRWTFWFHKLLGSSWVAAELAACQEGPSIVELVSVIM